MQAGRCWRSGGVSRRRQHERRRPRAAIDYANGSREIAARPSLLSAANQLPVEQSELNLCRATISGMESFIQLEPPHVGCYVIEKTVKSNCEKYVSAGVYSCHLVSSGVEWVFLGAEKL